VSLARGYYLYLCDQPAYPGFREDYFGFPLSLAPGQWWQNAVLYDFPLDQVDPSISGFQWYWYAALLDPDSKALISDISINYSRFSRGTTSRYR
ncbi:MAG: hypothetical protein JXM70_13725, partial [Pirellulales bacterium]|nr:hypothetical protein [Pirellulales bacterium]